MGGGGSGGAAGDAAQPRPRVPSSRDGAVSVRDGAVLVRRPRAGGCWPSVEAPEPIADHPAEVRINGRPLTGRRVVRETDRIEVCKAEHIVPGGIDVEIAEDGLRAWVTVHPPVRHEVRFADARPALRARLALRLRETVLPPDAGEEEVVAVLERAGVHVPLREGAVQRSLAGPGERVLVAEGVPARRGQPTTLWNCFNRQFRVWQRPSDPCCGALDVPGDGADGRPPVEMGETLIVVRPGRPGASGYTVTGEAVSDDAWMPPRLVAGPGVILSDDGLTAIAAQPGSVATTAGPDWIGVAVYEQRFVDGDVEAHSRLHVRGNLHVAGSVEPNSEVHAAGRVDVKHDVQRARIEAGGGIEIDGGVTNGLLLVGGAALIYGELMADFQGFIEAATGIDRASGVDASAGADQGEDGWTPRLRRMGFRIVSALEKADLECDAVVVEFGQALSAAMARRRVARLELVELRELLRQAEAAGGCMRAALALPAHCRVGHLDHTRIDVTGDVEVTGSGCYRTNIRAGGSVRVAGSFRDGGVAAGGDATFEEIGSPGEVVTRVQLPADGRFAAQMVHPGTVVRIGLHTRIFELPVHNAVLGRDAPEGAVPFARAVKPRSGRVRAERAAV